MVCDPWEGPVAPFCFSTIWYSARWGGNLPLSNRGTGTEAFGISNRVRLDILCFLKETPPKKIPALNHFDNKIIWDELPLPEQCCMFLLWNKRLDNCLTDVFCRPCSYLTSLLRGRDLHQHSVYKVDICLLYLRDSWVATWWNKL